MTTTYRPTLHRDGHEMICIGDTIECDLHFRPGSWMESPTVLRVLLQTEAARRKALELIASGRWRKADVSKIPDRLVRVGNRSDVTTRH